MATTTRAGRKRVTLECAAEPGSDVFVAGTFNDWDPTKKAMTAINGDGQYRAVLMLPPGQHEYKFVVGNDWLLDESNPQWKLNPFGSLNNVLTVK